MVFLIVYQVNITNYTCNKCKKNSDFDKNLPITRIGCDYSHVSSLSLFRLPRGLRSGSYEIY